ncbi:unnamed protein product [Phytomonas sp. Hart1]|nr:unnamed protein product [Phytomonas sp. Hart1]|eukprot:CCW69431.1 unnamed protein product [Phytomonas sp. isolate Hart1]
MPSVEGIIVFTTPEEARDLVWVAPSYPSTRSKGGEIHPKETPTHGKFSSRPGNRLSPVSERYHSRAGEAVLRHYRTLLTLLRQRLQYEAGACDGYSANTLTIDYSFIKALLPCSKTARGLKKDPWTWENVYLAHIEEEGCKRQASAYFIDVGDIYTIENELQRCGESPERDVCNRKHGKESRKTFDNLISQGSKTLKHAESGCPLMKANSILVKEVCVETKGVRTIIEAARYRFFTLMSCLPADECKPSTQRDAVEFPKVIVVVLCDEDFALFASADAIFPLPQLWSTFANSEASASAPRDPKKRSSNMDTANSFGLKRGSFTPKGYPRIFPIPYSAEPRDSQTNAPPLTPPRWMLAKEESHPRFPPGVQVVRSAFVVSSLHFGVWCVPRDFIWGLHHSHDGDSITHAKVKPPGGLNGLDQLIHDSLAACLQNPLAESIPTRHPLRLRKSLSKRSSRKDPLFTDSPFSPHQLPSENGTIWTSLYGSKLLSPWGWISQAELGLVWKTMLAKMSSFSLTNAEDHLPSLNTESPALRQSNSIFHENVERILREIDERYVQGIRNKIRKYNWPQLDEESSDSLWVCQKVLRQQLLFSDKMIFPPNDWDSTSLYTTCPSDFQQHIFEQLRYLESSPDAAVSKILCAFRGLLNRPFSSLRKRARHSDFYLPFPSLDFSSKWLRRFVQAPCIPLTSLTDGAKIPPMKRQTSLPKAPHTSSGFAPCFNESAKEEDEGKTPELADFAHLVLLMSALPDQRMRAPIRTMESSDACGIFSFFTAPSLGLLDNTEGRAMAAAANAFFFDKVENTDPSAHPEGEQEKGISISEKAFINTGDFLSRREGEDSSAALPYEKENDLEDYLVYLRRKAVYFAVEIDQPNTRHLIRLLECFLNTSTERVEEEAATFNDNKGGANISKLPFNHLGAFCQADVDDPAAALPLPFQLPPPVLAALRQYWEHIAEEANSILEDLFNEEISEGEECHPEEAHKERNNIVEEECAAAGYFFSSHNHHSGNNIYYTDDEEEEGGAAISSKAPITSFETRRFNFKEAWRPLTGLEALKLYMQLMVAGASPVLTDGDNSIASPENEKMDRIRQSDKSPNVNVRTTINQTSAADAHWLRHALFILSYGAGDSLEYLQPSGIVEMAKKILESKLGENVLKADPNDKFNSISKKKKRTMRCAIQRSLLGAN